MKSEDNDNIRKFNITTEIIKQINPYDFTPINIKTIRKFCYLGLLQAKYRPRCWKILLGYFSSNKFKSSLYYKKQRQAYKSYLNDIENTETSYYDVLVNDVTRTFIEPVLFYKKETCAFLDTKHKNSNLTHRSKIIRILKCFVLHNKSVGYIQGMVMLLIPIYKVFITSDDSEDTLYAEEDAFYCFNYLMLNLYENFLSYIDNEQNLKILMWNVWDILNKVDPVLYTCCVKKSIHESPIFLKWLFFLFSTEFKTEEVIWLWDRLLSDSNRFNILNFCIVAVFRNLRTTILNDSYEQIMYSMQNISLLDIKSIFYDGETIRLSLCTLEE